jgi:hypothetical protein
MKSILSLFKNLSLIAVIFAGILASRTLLFGDGYFNMHDDLQMMRQLQMEKCFIDGQIPCRWVPDMGYGFGFPLFNFYPPLPYLFGELFRLVGFDFTTTAKLTFAFSIILSGVFMYYLTKEFYGRAGAVLSSVFYMWAPYHAVDVYVRGAMNESWALTFFPLIMWAGYRLIVSTTKANNAKWLLILAFSYFGLLTSHNLMVLIFTPVFGLWLLLHLWQRSAWKKVGPLFLSGIWAFCMGAFFTIPAVVENGFTQIRSQLIGYYEYTAHFVSIDQLLFSRFWGYGPSVWLEEDRMSFQIGYVHWILTLFVALFLVIRIHAKDKHNIVKEIKNDTLLLVSGLFLAVGWVSAYMTHLKSVAIWQSIDQLKYLQFPWRFLTLVIFGFSFAIGVIPGLFADWKKHHNMVLRIIATVPQVFITGLLIILAIGTSWSYFLPEGGKLGNLTDEQKFTGAAWDLQQTAGIYDYLPIGAKRAPNGPQTTPLEILEGEGDTKDLSQGTYWTKGNVTVNTESAKIRINTFDFPGWVVKSNNVEIPHYIDDSEEWGRMYINLPKGDHQLYIQFYNTPVRTYSNLLSLIALLAAFFYLWKNVLIGSKEYEK